MYRTPLDQEVKQYFPEPRVLTGLFKLVETLYGLHITESSAPVWHADVKFYTLSDHSGQRVGQFYLDLYARASKRGGAWMDDVITRRKTAQGIQTPVAYLNCNFSSPVGGKPALFTHLIIFLTAVTCPDMIWKFASKRTPLLSFM